MPIAAESRGGSGSPPVLTTIVVSPSPITLAPGATQQFTASGFDQTGAPMAIDPYWSASGGAVSASGVYNAPQAEGEYLVTASDGSVSGSSTVWIGSTEIVWPTGGWATASPGELGMDAAKLQQARNYAGSGSGLIARHGRVVMTWGSQTQRYDVKSVTKSIGATLLGVALRDGVVELSAGAQTLLSDFGTPPSSNVSTGWLPGITLRHLATHTAGFDKPGGFVGLLFQAGTAWAYSDAGANWLADVLTVRYGRDMHGLLDERILGPLGIPSSHLAWRSHMYRPTSIQGITRREFASGITISVDAMARIGYLHLHHGRWQNTQLLDSSFVAAVRVPAAGLPGLPVANDSGNEFAGATNHYGLFWWNNADGAMPNVPPDTYFAWGHGDALIVVIPSLAIVAARAGSAWRGDRSPSFYEIINPFIEAIATAVYD